MMSIMVQHQHYSLYINLKSYIQFQVKKTCTCTFFKWLCVSAVLQEQVRKYKEVFIEACRQVGAVWDTNFCNRFCFKRFLTLISRKIFSLTKKAVSAPLLINFKYMCNLTFKKKVQQTLYDC